ncbi:MAG: hypothetical protein AAF391_03315 [Bacteroidota bacterium]
MNIKISTKVGASLKKVQEGFTRELFLSLNPPFPPVKLLEFGGCKTGDKVVLELNFIFFKQHWISDITVDQKTESQWYFVDEGRKLPFFLKTWKHTHIVKDFDGGAKIIDDITFSTGTILTDLILYPLLALQFIYRKPTYKKVFRE